MENIIVELNGKKYLLVEEFLTPSNGDKLLERVKKYDCIEQGIKEIVTSFFGGNRAIIKILVPEENIIEYTKAGREL